MTSHPDLQGVGAVLAEGGNRPDSLYHRQQAALRTAISASGYDEPGVVWAIRAYLRAMRESEPASDPRHVTLPLAVSTELVERMASGVPVDRVALTEDHGEWLLILTERDR